MSHVIHLPLTATGYEIASAIALVQQRSRLRRCQDPGLLADEVVAQLTRAQLVAAALGVELAELLPAGCWWEGSSSDAETLVRVTSRRGWDGPATAQIEVYRGVIGVGDSQGQLRLILRRE